jgi:DNA polymerase III alpha subunit
MVEQRTTPYRDPADLWRRGGLNKRQILALARADAFASLGHDPARCAVGGARLLRRHRCRSSTHVRR